MADLAHREVLQAEGEVGRKSLNSTHTEFQLHVKPAWPQRQSVTFLVPCATRETDA